MNTTKQTQHNATKSGRVRAGYRERSEGKAPGGGGGEEKRGCRGWGSRDAQQEQQGATARTGKQLGLHIRVQK